MKMWQLLRCRAINYKIYLISYAYYNWPRHTLSARNLVFYNICSLQWFACTAAKKSVAETDSNNMHDIAAMW